jgi:PilZ domain
MGIGIVPPETGYAAVRRWPRYKVDVPIRVITQLPAKIAVIEGRGRELNCGGMTVFVGAELALGQQVAVEFTPPYLGQPIRVRCFVRNRTGYSFGVEFITENDADYRAVAQLEMALKAVGEQL